MKVNWKHTLYPHRWVKDIKLMREAANQLGYLLFAWNGRIYNTQDGKDLGAYEEEK